MPWGWSSKPHQSIHVGGPQGTATEAKKVSTWPNYEAAYLAKRLGSVEPKKAYADRYKAGLDDDDWVGDEVARQVYLDKITSNYQDEADECLKAEFKSWLEGTHDDNANPETFPNRPGQAHRRAVFPTWDNGTMKQPGETLDGWKPTWWNRDQLTHLDGVRPFLRAQKSAAEEQEFALNVLAEFGPNNIDQAWTYFKHWVKGRPIAPEDCLHKPHLDIATHRSTPTHMARTRLEHTTKVPEPPKTFTQQVFGGTAVDPVRVKTEQPTVAHAADTATAVKAAVDEVDMAVDKVDVVLNNSNAPPAPIVDKVAENLDDAKSHLTHETLKEESQRDLLGDASTRRQQQRAQSARQVRRVRFDTTRRDTMGAAMAAAESARADETPTTRPIGDLRRKKVEADLALETENEVYDAVRWGGRGQRPDTDGPVRGAPRARSASPGAKRGEEKEMEELQQAMERVETRARAAAVVDQRAAAAAAAGQRAAAARSRGRPRTPRRGERNPRAREYFTEDINDPMATD